MSKENGFDFLYELQFLNLEDIILSMTGKFTEKTKIEVQPISPKEYEQKLQPPTSPKEILQHIQRELGAAYYFYDKCFQMDIEICKNQDKTKDAEKDVNYGKALVSKAFYHIGLASALYTALFTYEIAAKQGAKSQRSSQASKAAKGKNKKERAWVLSELDRVKKLSPDYEGCGTKGRLIKDKFARKYSELVKDKFNIDRNRDKLTPSTILRWIK